MNRSFLVLPFLASTLATGCSTYGDDTAGDNAGEQSGGSDDIVWGSAGSSSSGSDDSGDSTDSGDTEDSGSGLPTDDSGDSDSGVATGPITAKVYVHEITPSTDVCLYGIANVSQNDWSEFSSAFCSTSDSRGDGWLYQSVTYTPGEILGMNGSWSDGTSNGRYLAEAGGLLTNVDYILVVFADNSYEIYDIGTSSEIGHAYIEDGSYVDGSGNTINTQDWYIVTTTNTTGDYTM